MIPNSLSAKHSTTRRRRDCVGLLAVLACLLIGCNKEQTGVGSTQTDTVSATSNDTRPAQVATEDSLRESDQDTISRITQRSPINALTHDQWPAARFASSGQILPDTQRPGDPVKGRRALLEQNYVSCGLPERVFRELLGDTAVSQAPDRNAAADGLPYNVNVFVDSTGTSIVSNNCLTCHGSTLFGELVVGLGNEFLDFTGDSSALAERAGLLVNGESETLAWEHYADRVAAIAPYIRTHTIGVNPANNLTFALLAHRDAQTHAWSDQPLMAMPPVDPPPVSVPPWWRMHKKPAMFNLGEGRHDHARLMMAASMLCTDTFEELDTIDAYAPDIRAYIASLQPPPWPFDVDTALAAAGESLFEANCAQCHGSYGDQPTYPAQLVPIEVVGTDSTLVDFVHGDGVRFIDWFNRSYYGQLSVAAPGAGYVAPPLDGIWATGPFLHNGSVPSIRAVLDSANRPRYWQHSAQSTDSKAHYNQRDLGWNYESLTTGKDPQGGTPLVYDTDLPGYANTGHRFGDHLSEHERSAVIEYIKTL